MDHTGRQICWPGFKDSIKAVADGALHALANDIRLGAD